MPLHEGVPMPHLSPSTLTHSEQKAILRATACNPRDHLIYSLALGTGLRLAEIVGLAAGDVYTDDRTPRKRLRICPDGSTTHPKVTFLNGLTGQARPPRRDVRKSPSSHACLAARLAGLPRVTPGSRTWRFGWDRDTL